MSETWELDFYSRPILDDQDKKKWEVLICNSQRTFELSRWCAGSEANARWLQGVLQDALQQWREQMDLGDNARPEKIRFFRRPMATIISRACDALQIPAIASRRAYALVQWLQERQRTVYPTMAGYQPLMPPVPELQPPPPIPLPDQLKGEGWSIVSLPFADLAESTEWDIKFRDGIPLQLLDLSPETVVPGLLVYSRRATPLAGWMSGLEVSSVAYAADPQPQLLLETGMSDRWSLVMLGSAALQQEAASFEAAKQNAENVHFLAIQDSPESQSFAGFWLLQTLMLD